MVAVQVYWPLSDILRGEKVWPIEVVSVADTVGGTLLSCQDLPPDQAQQLLYSLESSSGQQWSSKRMRY